MQNTILIIGLGNPGKQYQNTRHSAGFLFLDMFKNEFVTKEKWKEKYQGLYISSYFSYKEKTIQCFLLKPLTFMNLSGNSVCKCIQKEKILLSRTIVLHDEIELPFGEIRWKEGGGHRGHNGLRDIIQKCGNEFNRIRIGVGRPKDMGVADYLLSPFTKEEQKLFPAIYEQIKTILLKQIEEKILSKSRV